MYRGTRIEDIFSNPAMSTKWTGNDAGGVPTDSIHPKSIAWERAPPCLQVRLHIGTSCNDVQMDRSMDELCLE